VKYQISIFIIFSTYLELELVSNMTTWSSYFATNWYLFVIVLSPDVFDVW